MQEDKTVMITLIKISEDSNIGSGQEVEELGRALKTSNMCTNPGSARNGDSKSIKRVVRRILSEYLLFPPCLQRYLIIN